MIRIVLLLLLSVSSPTAFGCIAKDAPTAKNFDGYEVVFVGKVVGIRLSGYIEASKNYGPEFDSFSDLTLPHDVEVLTIRSLKGDRNRNGAEKLTLEGCGVRIPAPGENGIFAIDASGKVFALYEPEHAYTGTLIDLTACAAGRCRTIDTPK